MANKNLEVWQKHYQKNKSKLIYPDENVVRYFNSIPDNQKSGLVVDLGSGSGRHLSYLETVFNKSKVFGLDFTQEYLKDHNSNTCARLEALPFKSKSFQYILCWGILHYLNEDKMQVAIKELRRVLEPNGRALITLRSNLDTSLAEVLSNGDLSSGVANFFTVGQAVRLFDEFSTVNHGFISRRPLNSEKLIAHHMLEVIK